MQAKTAKILKEKRDFSAERVKIIDASGIAFTTTKPLKAKAHAEELLPKEIYCCSMATD